MGEMCHKSLPERTADVISDIIYRENYRVGAKLPNEVELARRLEVSRNTLRQAIRILVDKGILEVERGAGTFVSSRLGMSDDPLGLSMVLDKNQLLKDLLEVRLLIEPRIAALAAERRTKEELNQIADICTRLEHAYSQGQNYYALDMEFHFFLAGCSRNLVVHSLLPAISQTIILQERVIQARMGKQTVLAHRRIYEAVVRGNGSEAYDAMMVHLVQNQERMLRQIEGKEKLHREETCIPSRKKSAQKNKFVQNSKTN